jgi:hypothetical protein
LRDARGQGVSQPGKAESGKQKLEIEDEDENEEEENYDSKTRQAVVLAARRGVSRGLALRSGALPPREGAPLPAASGVAKHSSELTGNLPVGNGNLKSELRMNATISKGGKVHLLTDKVARCGVGKHSQRRQWQTDLGEVTCQRCVKLTEADGRKKAQETQKGEHHE